MAYDDWGNVTYSKDPEGVEYFYSYANTSTQNQFTDSKGAPVALFSNAFYTNSIPSHCHTLLVGEASINSGKVKEVYSKYDANGNVTETKALFPTRNYSVFSGTFSEPGQTSFTIDLTGLTITNGVLVISAIPVPTSETLHETHSEPGTGWHNTGTWNQKSFYADYTQCTSVPEPDCFDGETEIGPFDHYPGSPNYTGYSTWVEDNHWQYVQTNYTAIVNEYPAKVEYHLNSTSWTVITNSLGAGTTSITIPSDKFIQGENTLQFRESNTYSTTFSWTLYTDQGSTPEQYVAMLAYDTYGNVISITDALNNTTLLGYDTQYHAYLTSITNALNHTLAATYDLSRGLVTSITDARGNTTSFEYDILGRVTKKINPDHTEKEAVYNDQDDYVIIYDELDHSTIRYYDGIGRLIKIEQHLTPTNYLTETYSYNYLNMLETRIDPGGHIYSYEYDSKGRSTKIINPDSTFREIHYDDLLNTVSVFDENLHKKEYHYDWTDRLLWVKEYTDPVNFYLTQYTYDSAGNVTSLVDANGYTTFYRYDSVFGMTQIVYPDSTAETFSYNAVGNLLQRINANGTTAFSYNAICQIVGIQYPDQASVAFAYDENGNRILTTDSEGTTQYTYDNRNRLLSKIRTIEGQAYATSYSYDAGSRLVSVAYPDQTTITYEYDSLNRLTRIPGYAEFTYTADSLLETSVYDNNTLTTYQYNSRDAPVTIHTQKNDTDLLLMDYQYDPAGDVTQLTGGRRSTDQQWVQFSETFAYDWLGRIVSAQGDYGLLTYSYDPVGNRMSQNSLTYAYNSMNELLTLSNGTTFTYDGMGNTLTRSDGTSTWSYTYDGRNQLTQVEENQKILGQYVYDGDGRRIKKTEWVESTQEYHSTVYIFSGLDVLYEKNVNTNQTAIYIYGPNGRIAKKVGNLRDYYTTDYLGSTRLVTDESGNVVTTMSYTPFGEVSTEGSSEHYFFTGKERDSTELYYYGARYYAPEIGRFITRDENMGNTDDPRTLNRYTYCFNNPMRYIDPDGHDCLGPDCMEKNTGEPLPTSQLRQSVGLFFSLFLWAIEKNCQVGSWLNGILSGYLDDFGALAVAAKLGKAGTPFGLIYLSYEAIVFPNLDKLWNDPKFRNLLSTAQMYASLESMGAPYEQELYDSVIELLAYAAQEMFGDLWRSMFPDLAREYDAMIERNKQSSSSSQPSSSGSGSSGTHTPPPGVDPV